MSKQPDTQHKTPETIPSSQTLLFFKKNLTYVNSQRLNFNRSKNFIKYHTAPALYTKILSPLNAPLGIASFSLYYLRFIVNLSLLAQLMLIRDLDKETKNQQQSELYYSLFNDLLWSTCNLVQFFWWTFARSQSAGRRGLQLEACAQLIDLLIMIINHQQNEQNYRKKYNRANPIERERLNIEWYYNQINFIRTLTAVGLIVAIFSLLAFTTSTIPISPLIFLINLSSALLRIAIQLDKDKKIIHHLCQSGKKSTFVLEEKHKLAIEHVKEVNKWIVDFVMLPISLFLIITAPLSITLTCLLSFFIIQSICDYYLNSNPSLGLSPPSTLSIKAATERLDEELPL